MRYKTILQHDERDCGAACLATISKYYHCQITLSYSRKLCKTDYLGTNIYGLIDAARKMNFEAEAFCGSEAELSESISTGELKFPFIAHIVNDHGLNHFIVVFSRCGKDFVCGDPAYGTMKVSSEEFYKKWTGYVVSIKPGELFPANVPKSSRIKEIASLLDGVKGKIIMVTLLSFLISGIGIAGSFVFELVLDEYTAVNYSSELAEISELDEDGHTHESNDDDKSSEVESELGFLTKVENAISSQYSTIFISITLLYILQGLIQWIRGRLILSLSKSIDVRIMTKYFSHIQDMIVEDVRRMRTGEYLSRLSDADAVRDAVSTLIVTVILDLTMVIGCGFILCFLSFELFLISLIVLIIYAVIVLFYKSPLERTNRLVMENNAEVQSYFKETIDGFETIHAAVAEKNIKQSLSAKYHVFADSVVKNGLLSVSMDAISDTLEMVGIMIMLWVGFLCISSGTLTLGILMTFYALMGYFSSPAKNLINLQPELERAKIAFARLHDVTDIEVEKELYSGIDVPEAINTWSAESVSFRYGNHELVLRDISFRVSKGEKIAFVGESGCGKTTIAKLIMRFYQPESGRIKINGDDINSYDLKSFRQAIAYVSQDTFLFSDTLRNNLSLGITVPDEKIIKVCNICNLDKLFIEGEAGLDVQIEENGANLSGGQRQRIALARALLREPQLLILDEATSQLDTMTENSIQNAIDTLSDKAACIIITHRLATVTKCDRIYVIKEGCMIGAGGHNELLKNNEYYAALWREAYGNLS